MGQARSLKWMGGDGASGGTRSMTTRVDIAGRVHRHSPYSIEFLTNVGQTNPSCIPRLVNLYCIIVNKKIVTALPVGESHPLAITLPIC